MISVQEAKELIAAEIKPSKQIELNLQDALGYVLCEDIYSPINFPTYAQSAMDGYGFCMSTWDASKPLRVSAEIQAGQNVEQLIIETQCACRIFTGAPIPTGVDTVVMQEKIIREGDLLFVKDEQLEHGQHIRGIASQTKQGDLVLAQGHQINPMSAGLLSSVGISTVCVYRAPKIILLHTGKELVAPGNMLQHGQVYESNSVALRLALQSLPHEIIYIRYIDDDEIETTNMIEEALRQADFILLTGGVSVGDYDFVLSALEKNNVVQHFHKIKQKPGKPLYFGSKENCFVFGLPGNPGSVMTCFYHYVKPALLLYLGSVGYNSRSILLPIASTYTKNAGLTHFLKGKIVGTEICILDHQESYKMNSFALADGFIEIEEACIKKEKGELVKVYLF